MISTVCVSLQLLVVSVSLLSFMVVIWFEYFYLQSRSGDFLIHSLKVAARC